MKLKREKPLYEEYQVFDVNDVVVFRSADFHEAKAVRDNNHAAVLRKVAVFRA